MALFRRGMFLTCKSFISGCVGLRLNDEEVAFFRGERPVGLILFARNCEDKEQVRALVEDYREALHGEDVFVLIDQEGGRVARLKPPHWLEFPAARKLGALLELNETQGLETARLLSQLLASELHDLGINVDCLPVLDIPVPGADDIIGDRAYGESSEVVIGAGRAVAEGLMAGGVLPVIKHVPGHGRAACDSHKDLPVIDVQSDLLETCDFVPFKALADLPLAMTAHILLPLMDPDNPVSTSKKIIDQVIRNHIGFDGVLMCDDLSMEALSGSMRERAARALAAGCDLALHCNGEMAEMVEVAAASTVLEGDAERRVKVAFSRIIRPQEFDRERADRLRLDLLSA